MFQTYTHPTFDYKPSAEQQTGTVKRHPVVIIGAGPVGLTQALDLAYRGVPSIVLDDDNTVSVGSRAVCYAKRTLEIWDRLGFGEESAAKGVQWKVGKVFFKNDLAYQFDLLWVLAERAGVPIAGALNFLGSEALYGRYWGCTEEVPFLHFELCYYRAIEEAIALGLTRVEAGAQGEHKLARGYVATPTYSAHYIPHPGFRAAVADFLDRERRAVARDRDYLQELTPFRKAD